MTRFPKQFLTTLCVYSVHTVALHTYYCNVYITITRHLIGWAESYERPRAHPSRRRRN